MFERFTERARKVMALANREAQRLGCEYIGTEHMLLGLLIEGEGVGANVLKSLGVDLKAAREKVEALSKAKGEKTERNRLPVTPRAKKATEYAIQEARRIGHNYIGTEHLLLGLLRSDEGLAAAVLRELGVNLDAARQAVLKLVNAGREEARQLEVERLNEELSEPGLHVNVEIKARCSDLDRARAALKEMSADFLGTDHQTDTYFRVPRGRLKIREGTIENSLIHYDRPDLPGPKEAMVHLCPLSQSEVVKDTLARALGVLVTVRKSREIYYANNVKIHVDAVDGLGAFVEIEAHGRSDEANVASLRKQCEAVMERFGIGEADLIDRGYSDMLLG